MRNGAEFYWDEKTAEQLRRVWRGEYFRSKANGAATAAATDDDDLDLAEWDWGDDNEPIPPRGWLLGNLLCRQFLTSIFADGGVGKTALIIAMALSLATGRNLIGEHVFVRCRVLLFCFEDGVNELRRRLTAAMMHYGITKDEIRGYLFISAINRADAKLATMRRGELVVGRLGAALEKSIVRRHADAVFLDPFVKTHAVGENDNSSMDFVAEILASIAIKHDCACCTPHHTRKGAPDPGNADAGRGGGALKDAFRLCYTATPATEPDAKALGISADDRVGLIRLDSGKVNLVRNSFVARWFRLVGVRIGNSSETYPHGDEIQAIERWYPPDAFKGVGDDVWNRILDDIAAGIGDGGRYTDHAMAADDRQAFRVVQRHLPDRSVEKAKAIIKGWKQSGLLVLRTYHDDAERKDKQGFVVDDSKRPGPR